MRLGLLMDRRYPPYGKWLGTAFARLPDASRLLPPLASAVSATRWPDRERALVQALEAAAARHNELGLTGPLDTAARGFFDRPYQVLEAGRFATALRDAVSDPRIRRLPATGAVDQLVDSTDALRHVESMRAVVAAVYRLPAGVSSGS
jgi:hypothetical protein